MRSDAKRTHSILLKAARQVLGSASINNMTMHAIIEVSGVSKAQVYRHFRTPNDVVADLAAELLRDINKELEARPEEFEEAPAATYARAAVKVLTSDSVPNRQIILYGSVQHEDGKWVPAAGLAAQGNAPETLFEKWGVELDDTLVALTYFRGAMYSWACGFFTDEMFAAETERSISMKEPAAKKKAAVKKESSR
jgi:AcrR family transcriptional regulator